MFTGIVQAIVKVSAIEHQSNLMRLSVCALAPLCNDLQLGASVAIEGVCLTVSQVIGDTVCFDVIAQTLNVTSLSRLQVGDKVNWERSARFGDEIGGHVLSGHVQTTAMLINIDKPENNHILTLQISPEWYSYVFEKGFIAIAGASLTIASVDKQNHCFTVHLIPETLVRTSLSMRQVGDEINVEIDSHIQAIVDTTHDVIKSMTLTELN